MKRVSKSFAAKAKQQNTQHKKNEENKQKLKRFAFEPYKSFMV